MLFDSFKVGRLKKIEQPSENQLAIRWFESNFQKALFELEDHFSKFRMSDALMTVYKLIWNDFCSWYLEWDQGLIMGAQ